MSELTAHEVLVRARNLIEREGWAFKRPDETWCFADGARANCALNALSVVEEGRITDAADVLADTLGLGPDEHPADVLPEWNDTPGRTKAEVLVAFDRAISATAPSPADPLADLPSDPFSAEAEMEKAA